MFPPSPISPAYSRSHTSMSTSLVHENLRRSCRCSIVPPNLLLNTGLVSRSVSSCWRWNSTNSTIYFLSTLPCTTCTPGQPKTHCEKIAHDATFSGTNLLSLSLSLSLSQPHHALKSPDTDDHRRRRDQRRRTSCPRAHRFFYRGRTKKRNGEEVIPGTDSPDEQSISLTASGNRDEGWTIDASLVQRRLWFWISIVQVHTGEARLDSLDLPVERFSGTVFVCPPPGIEVSPPSEAATREVEPEYCHLLPSTFQEDLRWEGRPFWGTVLALRWRYSWRTVATPVWVYHSFTRVHLARFCLRHLQRCTHTRCRCNEISILSFSVVSLSENRTNEKKRRNEFLCSRSIQTHETNSVILFLPLNDFDVIT